MKPFTTPLRVRFGDIDGAGVAYYPRIVDFLHVAFEEFFEREVGVPYPVWIGRRRIGFPTVRLEAEFRIPLRHGDRPRAAIRCEGIGRSSIRLRIDLLLPRRRRPAVTARLTVVAVDLRRFRPVGIPSAVRRAFAGRLSARPAPR